MMNKLFFGFICFVITLSVQATSARQELKNLKHGLEIEIQNHLESTLKERHGFKDVLISAEVTLQEKELLRTMGVDSSTNPEVDSLPGFSSGGYETELASGISLNDTWTFIDNVKIKLAVLSEEYDRAQLETFTSLLTSNLTKLPTAKIKISSEINPIKVVKANNSQTQTHAKKFNWKDFFGDNWRFLAASLAGLFGISILSYVLRNGFNKMGQSLGSKESQNSAPLPMAAPTTNDYAKSLKHNEERGHKDQAEIRKDFQEICSRCPQEFDNFIQIKADLGEIPQALLLVQFQVPEQREFSLTRLAKQENSSAEKIVAKYSQNLLELQQSSKLTEMAELFKLCLLRSSSLKTVVLIDTIKKLSSFDLNNLYKEASPSEQQFLLSHLSEASVGQLISLESIDEFKKAGEDSEEEVVSSLTKLIGAQRKLTEQKHHQERNLRIYSQMPSKEAEIFADQMLIESDLRLNALFENYKTEGMNFFKSLPLEKMGNLVSLLDTEIRKELTSSLPEILAERLKFYRTPQTSAAGTLKGEFYFYLYKIHEQTKISANTSIDQRAA